MHRTRRQRFGCILIITGAGSVIRSVSQLRAHPVNSTINLSFRYAESDYVRALRAHYASHLRLRLDIVVTVVLVGIGVYLWQSASLHWLGLTCIIIAVAFALMLIAAFTVIPPLAFRREPKFRDDYSLTFSSEGIHFRTTHIDSQLQWSMYSRALIDAHSYVLYYGTRQFTVIPKRVFQSAEQQQAFEQLLAQRISQIVRQDA
jgi:YcxB-like protein